jgi:hypothetical protein
MTMVSPVDCAKIDNEINTNKKVKRALMACGYLNAFKHCMNKYKYIQLLEEFIAESAEYQKNVHLM